LEPKPSITRELLLPYRREQERRGHIEVIIVPARSKRKEFHIIVTFKTIPQPTRK
jgi:hypothetical protein